jgi:hypothetical protein
MQTIFRMRVSQALKAPTTNPTMKKPKLLRQIAMYGISLPTLAASPAVAKATVYMPSHIAARMLGGRGPKTTVITTGDGITPVESRSDEPHAA